MRRRETHNTGPTEFAHGSYGDDSGVVFYGPTIGRLPGDRLAVSDRFIGPLLLAVLERAAASGGSANAPRLAAQWNEAGGWADAAAGVREVSPADATELANALAGLAEGDVAGGVAGVTPAECVRCGAAITAFLRGHVSRDRRVFIEDD